MLAALEDAAAVTRRTTISAAHSPPTRGGRPDVAGLLGLGGVL